MLFNRLAESYGDYSGSYGFFCSSSKILVFFVHASEVPAEHFDHARATKISSDLKLLKFKAISIERELKKGNKIFTAKQ